MIKKLYQRSFEAIKHRFFPVWGITLLYSLLVGIGSLLFGVIPGVALGIAALLGGGMSLIFLRVYRGESVECIQLFELCRDWKTVKRMLCGMGWMALWIFIWGLIPIAGPVIAVIRGYEYSLTLYILAYEPDVSATQAIKASSAKTRGYKGKMFLADVLIIAALVVPVLVIMLLSAIPGMLGSYAFPWFGVLLIILLYIAYLVGAPIIIGLVRAGFYEEINNRASCPSCGAAVDPGAAFCPSCGRALGRDGRGESTDGLAVCSCCGAPLAPGSAFCTQCGKKVE